MATPMDDMTVRTAEEEPQTEVPAPSGEDQAGSPDESQGDAPPEAVVEPIESASEQPEQQAPPTPGPVEAQEDCSESTPEEVADRDAAPVDTGSTGRTSPYDLMFLDSAYVQTGHESQEHPLSELLRTPASRIMDKEVVWALPDDTVQDVIGKMQQRNCGYVLIGFNRALEGLISNSNILGAVSLYLRPMFAKWRRPEDEATLGVKVKWIMSRPVRTVRPDTPLAGVIECMRRCGGRCLPVVDERGGVRGVITAFDILLHILREGGDFTWKGKPPQAPAWLI
jgi:CBS domain-containing protein